MTPYFINYSDIYYTEFDYNRKQVRIHVNSHSKATITYVELPHQLVDIHIGDVSKPGQVSTIYEDCTIVRKKTKKGESQFFIAYQKSRGARLSDIRPYLIDAILADLE